MGRVLAAAALGSVLVAVAASGATANPASGRVVRHEAGGRVIRAGGVLPKVQVVRTTINGAEPTFGFDRRGRIYVDALGPTLGAAGHGGYTSTLVRFDAGGSHLTDINPGHPFTEDMYVYADPKTGRVFMADWVVGKCSALSYTDDGGEKWSPTRLPGCTLMDHQSIAAGPAPAGGAKPTGYPTVVYYCAIEFGYAAPTNEGSGCERSLDGGDTWLPTLGHPFVFDPSSCVDGYYTVLSACEGSTGQQVVAPNGAVLVPMGFNGQPRLAISDDEGDTWRRVQVAGNGLRDDAYGYTVEQTSVAADSAGNFYYTWVARDRMPYLSWSRDQGRTWSRPLMIGKPGLRQAWQSVLDSIAPGRVAVHYLATEDGASKPFPDDRYCRSSDPVVDAKNAATAVLAYEGLASNCPLATPDYAHTTWNAYLTVSSDLFARDPSFTSAQLNPPGDPIEVGYCSVVRCPHEFDFTDVHISPYDGSAWATYLDGCTPDKQCTKGQLQLARLVGIDLRAGRGR